ncbi:MAG: class I SAM-dependent methyltransferase, partial [Acidobacteria bacterium]|nr:class I SAM-dependent methyltransferase [Acidobacteriota bacterium]
MSLRIDAAERGWLPELLLRLGIRRLLRQRLAEERAGGVESQARRLSERLEAMEHSPLALSPGAANEQHYEVPAEFFRLVLGPHLKYSAGLWPKGVATLGQAEEAMLELTCRRAGIADGMSILELGCGWGSLSLWIAERFPSCRVLAVSNSALQRRFIESEREGRGLSNLEVVTADMNGFDPGGSFDRVVSVEMFEHMRNYEELLRRIAGWLRPDGKLFVH